MKEHKILLNKKLTKNTFILRFEKKDLRFVPGQHLCVGVSDDDDRPYSIYNGENDEYIEILIREVQDGNISKKLKQLKTNDLVSVEHPHGYFCIKDKLENNPEFVFIATGTGISPFHSFIKSYPDLSYTLIHGVRTTEEAYDADFYPEENYVLCTSRDSTGKFTGRVTDYIKTIELNPKSYYYLCGNSEMIDDVYNILESRGISRNNIRTETYF